MEHLDINRKIVISEPISDELAGKVIEIITAINDYDSAMEASLKNYQRPPIEMFINSGGGSATAGYAIISAMEISDNPIITYGIGIVASMALAIFVAGDIRIAHRFCRMMYHSVSYGMDGHITDQEAMLQEANILQEMYDSLFTDRTKMTVKQMKDIRRVKKDFFFSAKKAVVLGIADEVMEKPERKFELITEEEVQEIEKQLDL